MQEFNDALIDKQGEIPVLFQAILDSSCVLPQIRLIKCSYSAYLDKSGISVCNDPKYKVNSNRNRLKFLRIKQWMI